jgi:[ribosomal protein S18]-alanine N-acetyltransferase
MAELAALELARVSDAGEIARMSRDYIEHGLEWSWTAARVERAIRSRDTSVVVARRDSIAGFAIMHFGDDAAHLNLLAVAAEHRRQGLATRLLDWLKASADTAGILRIDLELRLGNDAAREFYERHGFVRTATVPGYYQGRESALRMSWGYGS